MMIIRRDFFIISIVVLVTLIIVQNFYGVIYARVDGPEGGNYSILARELRGKRRAQQQESLKLLDAVRNGVKSRRTTLEDEAKKEGEDYLNRNHIQRRLMREQVDSRRKILLAKVEGWSQAGKKAILAISEEEIAEVTNEAMGIADYYGMDTDKLTRLYDLGKNVIKDSWFELPDNTHPDDDYTLETLKRRAMEGAANGMRPALVQSFEQAYDAYFDNATTREIEIAEFMARQQEYRVQLFKRVTLAYLKALLLSGEPLPACDVRSKPLQQVEIDGQKVLTVGCSDPSLEYLKKYVNAIRTLQSAEIDTFMVHAQMVIAEQQLVVDLASAMPLVGDAIDWYSLMYGLYAHEDFTGHCLSYADHSIQLVAAAIPFVGPKMLEGVIARNPETAERLVVNLDEIFTAVKEVATYQNLRESGGNILSRLARSAGNALSDGGGNPLLENMAERWGVTPEQLEQFARNVQAAVKKAERSEKQAAEKALAKAQEAAAKKAKAKMANIMGKTIANADDEIRALRQLQKEAPEMFERALKDAEDVFRNNLKALQTSQADAIKNSNMVDEHVEEILRYMQKTGSSGDGQAEKMVLIYRHVNPDSTDLIRQGFFTKGMDIKGKSADWGVHRGFIPIEQKFSKLANPNKRVASGAFSPEDITKQEKFQRKVTEFFTEKGQEAGKYSTELVVGGKPVMVVKDAKTGQEITAFFDPGSGRYLDENKVPFSADAIDATQKRPLKVMAVPDANGNPQALTADYDFLAMGFDSEVGMPGYNNSTGYISEKQKQVLKEINESIQEATGYRGDVSHHGPEVQYPESPGAFQDPLLTTIDLEHGVMTIPKCDQDCMRKWCSTSGMCSQFGFPNTAICNPSSPRPPCIPVDPDRLLKDYMHLKRLEDYKLFPNSSWEWGEYNVLGGWNMVAFMDTPKKPGVFDSSVRVARDLSGSVVRTRSTLQTQVYGFLLKGFKAFTECPYGQRASDVIEATP